MASAGPITVEFEITVPGSASAALTGSFTGEDLNANGFIGHFPSYSELSAFSLNLGGSPFYNHNLGDLIVLVFNDTADSLYGFWSRHGFNGAPNGAAPTWAAALLNVGGISVAGVRIGRLPIISRVNVTTTRVPEPGTLMLFGIGLLAFAYTSRRRQA